MFTEGGTEMKPNFGKKIFGEALLENMQVFASELAGGQQEQRSAAGASFLPSCCGPSVSRVIGYK